MARHVSLRPSMLNLARTLAPGPSPKAGTNSLYPTVLRVPPADYQAFLREVVTRYESTLVKFWPTAILRSARQPHPVAVSNERLVEILWHTLAAQLLTREIDAGAAEAFAPILDAEGAKRWVVCDLTCIGNAKGNLLDGCYAAATRTLMEEQDEGDPVLRAIEVDGVLLRPEDGRAFELARLFVQQGMSHAVVMASHPKNHFPYDSINGITRKLLPAEHRVRQLLEPHCYIHLALNFGVLYSNRSVARNDQSNVYTPFSANEKGQFRITRAGWKGIPGSAVWKPYRYPLVPYAAVGPFGDFVRHYDGVLRKHVHRILEGVDAREPVLGRWADEIALHLPGFPGAERLAEPNVLADAVTTMIVGVSVVHSSEHFSYSVIPIEEVPLRLRVPPPTGRDAPPFRYESLTTRRDVFRQHLAHEMFFKVYPVRRLMDVEYQFHDPQAAFVGAALQGHLRAAQRTLPGREYAPLEMIASSLQY